jgi:hypothetical protein
MTDISGNIIHNGDIVACMVPHIPYMVKAKIITIFSSRNLIKVEFNDKDGVFNEAYVEEGCFALDSQPTGRWLDMSNRLKSSSSLTCSRCWNHIPKDDKLTVYCPACGSKNR